MKSSKKSKRRKGHHKKSRKKSCYYCENICDYHLEKINLPGAENIKVPKKYGKEQKEKHKVKNFVNESVQVGNPNAKYGYGHYLFDPTQVCILYSS